MNDNNNPFAIGDIVSLKRYATKEVEFVGFVIEVSLIESNTHRYRIHWFQAPDHPYWYNEMDLTPKG